MNGHRVQLAKGDQEEGIIQAKALTAPPQKALRTLLEVKKLPKKNKFYSLFTLFFEAEAKITNKQKTSHIYCLFIARINKLVDAYICARARISKAKMNENEENVDPIHDAAPDVEHLRPEISENREVFDLCSNSDF